MSQQSFGVILIADNSEATNVSAVHTINERIKNQEILFLYKASYRMLGWDSAEACSAILLYNLTAKSR